MGLRSASGVERVEGMPIFFLPFDLGVMRSMTRPPRLLGFGELRGSGGQAGGWAGKWTGMHARAGTHRHAMQACKHMCVRERAFVRA